MARSALCSMRAAGCGRTAAALDRLLGGASLRLRGPCAMCFAYVSRWVGAVRSHGRNPPFVPCAVSAVGPRAVRVVADASAVGRRPCSVVARGCDGPVAAFRQGAEWFATSFEIQCTFMCDVPFQLELSVRAYDCQGCSIVPMMAAVDRRVFSKGKQGPTRRSVGSIRASGRGEQRSGWERSDVAQSRLAGSAAEPPAGSATVARVSCRRCRAGRPGAAPRSRRGCSDNLHSRRPAVDRDFQCVP